jgi:hypothetical protein
MSKYWLVAWIWCCLMLVTLFYKEIQHQNSIDDIFDKYEIEMDSLHKSFNH